MDNLCRFGVVVETVDSGPTTVEGGWVRFATPRGRWVLGVAVLGSAIAFLEATVTNVALPTIARDLGTGVSGLQWVLNGYLLTLAALILLGGSLGDRYGRRVRGAPPPPRQSGDHRVHLPPRRPRPGDRGLVGADRDRCRRGAAARRLSDRRGFVAGGLPPQPPPPGAGG